MIGLRYLEEQVGMSFHRGPSQFCYGGVRLGISIGSHGEPVCDTGETEVYVFPG